MAAELRESERSVADTTDAHYMAEALRLARDGDPHPNPRVGALVVSVDGRVLGRGHHAIAGGPHAEIVALREAGVMARGATLFVTLEPCAHFGRTPPCVDAILRSGVRQVVIGCRDPNPHVSGGGVELLRGAGLEVVEAVLEADAQRLIAPWLATLL